MSVRILPIWKYPFHTIQDQIVVLDPTYNVIQLPDFCFETTGISRATYFASPNTPIVQRISCGSTNMTIRLAEVDLNPNVFAVSTLNQMQNISMFIFEDTLKTPASVWFYYYVNDVVQINKEIFEYSLTIDVIKTYFEFIKEIKEPRPVRYFPRLNDYYDFSKYSGVDIRDPLLPIPSNPSLKIPMVHKFNGLKLIGQTETPTVTFSGLWSYFYFSFSATGDANTQAYLGFRDEKFYIIAYPKNPDPASTGIGVGSAIPSNTTYNRLLQSPNLIKVIDSDIPPFNNQFTLSEDIIDLYFEINSINQTTAYVDMDFTAPTPSNQRIATYTDWTVPFLYIVPLMTDLADPTSVNNYLPKWLYDIYVGFGATNIQEYFFFVTDNNPNNMAKDNLLLPLDLTDQQLYAVPEYEVELYINNMKDTGENGEEEKTNLINPLSEIGYEHNNKMLLKNKLLTVDTDLTFDQYGTARSLATTISPVKLSDPADLHSSAGYGVSFSPDDTYLATTSQNSPYLIIYKRAGDVFTKLPDPVYMPSSYGWGCQFSPNGDYLVYCTGASPYIIIYKRSGDTFTKLSNPATLPTGTVIIGALWSSDSIYLAVGHQNSPYVTIYKRSGDTFTKLANPSQLPTSTATHGSFSPIANTYMAIGQLNSPYYVIYKRSGDTFTKLTTPLNTPPTSSCYDMQFSPDDTYLVSCESSTPYLRFYKRSGDTFTQLTNPTTMPAGMCRGASWSADGKFVSIACGSSPRIYIYQRSGDTFTKLPDPAILPSSNGQEVDFSKTNNNYLAIAHTGTPYITIYKNTVIFDTGDPKYDIVYDEYYPIKPKKYQFNFTSIIIHSIVSTKEKILYVNYDNNEIYAERSAELQRSQITDTYYEYMYSNQNAIIQKERQLKKVNDVKDIIGGVVGLAVGVAGTLATGGALAPLLIGAGMTGYNLISNLANNEQERKQYDAELKDRRLVPLAFDSGNYNNNELYTNYLVFLAFYRFGYDTSFDQATLLTKDVTNPETMRTIMQFGYYTPTAKEDNFHALFTREYYNFIQLSNYKNISTDYRIPNSHIQIINDALFNGVRFWNYATFSGNFENMTNKEVTPTL